MNVLAKIDYLLFNFKFWALKVIQSLLVLLFLYIRLLSTTIQREGLAGFYAQVFKPAQSERAPLLISIINNIFIHYSSLFYPLGTLSK
jgi:hypothetical protein